MNDLDIVEGYEVHLDNVAGIFYGCRVALTLTVKKDTTSMSCQTFETTLNDASPKQIGGGDEPRIASVPGPQDGHVHVGGQFHTTATPDRRDQSDGIFDPGHRNVPGFESKLF